MKKYSVYVNEVFQGNYQAINPGMAISLYCVDYQTTRNQIATLFNTCPMARLSEWQ